MLFFTCLSQWVWGVGEQNVPSALPQARAFPADVRAEWRHGERSHFFFAPHLIALMLACASRGEADHALLRAVFAVCLVVQVGRTPRADRGCRATPPPRRSAGGRLRRSPG